MIGPLRPDFDILQRSNRREERDGIADHFHHVDLLVYGFEAPDLRFGPFEQVVQQGKSLFCRVVGHRKHVVHFGADLLGRKLRHQQVENHLERTHRRAQVVRDDRIEPVAAADRTLQFFHLAGDQTLGCD